MSLVVFICISLTSSVEHLFIYLVAICMSSLEIFPWASNFRRVDLILVYFYSQSVALYCHNCKTCSIRQNLPFFGQALNSNFCLANIQGCFQKYLLSFTAFQPLLFECNTGPSRNKIQTPSSFLMNFSSLLTLGLVIPLHLQLSYDLKKTFKYLSSMSVVLCGRTGPKQPSLVLLDTDLDKSLMMNPTRQLLLLRIQQ